MALKIAIVCLLVSASCRVETSRHGLVCRRASWPAAGPVPACSFKCHAPGMYAPSHGLDGCLCSAASGQSGREHRGGQPNPTTGECEMRVRPLARRMRCCVSHTTSPYPARMRGRAANRAKPKHSDIKPRDEAPGIEPGDGDNNASALSPIAPRPHGAVLCAWHAQTSASAGLFACVSSCSHAVHSSSHLCWPLCHRTQQVVAVLATPITWHIEAGYSAARFGCR